MFGLRRWSSSVDVVIRIDAIKATKVCPLARHVNTSVAGFFGSEIDRRYWLFIELRCVAGKLVSAGIGIDRGEHKGGEGDLGGDLGGDHDAVWVGVSFLELMTRSTWLSLGIVGYAAAEILRRVLAESRYLLFLRLSISAPCLLCVTSRPLIHYDTSLS